MRLNWNLLCLAMLATLALSGAGCSGINASQSVSPAMLFMKAGSPKTGNPILSPESSKEFALNR